MCVRDEEWILNALRVLWSGYLGPSINYVLVKIEWLAGVYSNCIDGDRFPVEHGILLWNYREVRVLTSKRGLYRLLC